MNQVKKKLDGLDNQGKEKFVMCPFRSLKNYKAIHQGRAEKKGVGEQFQTAETLTRARRILFG
jgi:hypothetical protein